jgi:hypothetical protein
MVYRFPVDLLGLSFCIRFPFYNRFRSVRSLCWSGFAGAMVYKPPVEGWQFSRSKVAVFPVYGANSRCYPQAKKLSTEKLHTTLFLLASVAHGVHNWRTSTFRAASCRNLSLPSRTAIRPSLIGR